MDINDSRPVVPWKIDAHQHLWDLSVRPQPWTREITQLQRSFAVADLLPLLDANQVTGTVLVENLAMPEESVEMLALAAQSPRIHGVVGWLDLESDGVPERIAQLREVRGGHLLIGIRHTSNDEPDQQWLNRPAVHRGLRQLAQAELSYDIIATAAQLPSALAAVRAVPELRFVVDHCGMPNLATGDLERWAQSMDELASCENVVVKFSGLTSRLPFNWTVATLRPIADRMLQLFGAQRLMWASDWPSCLPSADYHQVAALADELTSGATGTERRAIFALTAQSWYRITGRGQETSSIRTRT